VVFLGKRQKKSNALRPFPIFAFRVAVGCWRGSDFAYCINLLFFSNTYKKVRVLTKGK
jgi:hypothetical protein